MRERISNFSVWISIAAFALAGLMLLGMLAAVLYLNSQTLPQTPVLLGPPH